MTLLDFARGPGLEWSLYILVAGSLLRLFGIFWMRSKTDLSQPRSDATTGAGMRTIVSRMWTRKEFRPKTLFPLLIAYGMHIGLAVVVFLFVPHILFIEGLLGISWPGLPNDIIMLAGTITIASIVALWVRRFNIPMLRIITTWDDHVALLLTLLPILTGMAAYAHLTSDYEFMLGLHLITVELLFIWFPFGKLFHAVLWIPSRFKLGAAFARRGVKA